MNYFVYIIYSKSLDVYYKGFSLDVEKRLISHLQGENDFTSKSDDWILVYKKAYEIKKDALIEEKCLKKLNRNSLDIIIKHKT